MSASPNTCPNCGRCLPPSVGSPYCDRADAQSRCQPRLPGRNIDVKHWLLIEAVVILVTFAIVATHFAACGTP